MRPSKPSPTTTSMTRPVRSYFVAGVQMPIFAEQHDADFRLVDVEGHAEQIAGELDQLLEAHAGKPGHFGDAGGDAGDRAHLSRHQLRRECFSRLA